MMTAHLGVRPWLLYALILANTLKSFFFYWWLSSEEKSWLGAAMMSVRSMATASISFAVAYWLYGRWGVVLFASAHAVLVTTVFLYVDANGYLPVISTRRLSPTEMAEAVRASARRTAAALSRCGWDVPVAIVYCHWARPADGSRWVPVFLAGAAIWAGIMLLFSFRHGQTEALWRLPQRTERAVYLYGYFAAELSWWLEISPKPKVDRIEPLPAAAVERYPAAEPVPICIAIQLESVGSSAIRTHKLFSGLTGFVQSEGGLYLPECQIFRGVGGTCDSEFAVLTGNPPPGDVAPQFRTDIDYEQSVPRQCERYGYTTIAMHGNTGLFYDRARWYREIGFSRLRFRNGFTAPPGRWGVEDDDVLRECGEYISNQGAAKSFVFTVLMSTHYPYNIFAARKLERREYPNRMDVVGRFCVSCGYLEEHLILFLRRLQLKGRYVCLLYGDHPPGVAIEPTGAANPTRIANVVPVWAISNRLHFGQRNFGREPTLFDVGATLVDACGGMAALGHGSSLIVR